MAMWVISQDINHAGYYGDFYSLPALGGALPDPCLRTPAALFDGLALPIQGYDAIALPSPLSCLGDANLVPGTDILVVRYAEYTPLAQTDVAQSGEVYIQGTVNVAQVQIGRGNVVGNGNIDGTTPANILKKDGVTAADIRKLAVHIYFIAPCSVPADGGDTCTGTADDGGTPIRTLKRLELTTDGAALVWRIAPLVEGIRTLQIDYGIDNSPATINFATNQFGDGSPDTYTVLPALADWANVVSVRLNFIAQATQLTTSYVDTKTYNLGLAGTVGPFNDAFKKHLFVGAARLNNVSGRREIPQ
jgi:type IV pilus assembly protein PilW